MVFDISVAVMVFLLAYRSKQLGGMAAFWQLVTVLGAGLLAKIVAAPTAGYLIKAISWPYTFAVGACFLTYFLLIGMCAHFVMARLVESASENHGDGGSLDQAVGFLIGAVRGAAIVYFLLVGTMLLTQRLGWQKPDLAFQYQGSTVGRWVMTHNIVDPEPFPHAQVLRVLVGAEDGSSFPNPQALATLADHPKSQALMADAQSVELIRNGDWKRLRDSTTALALVTDPAFLRAADRFNSPDHEVEVEEPDDRFEELRNQ